MDTSEIIEKISNGLKEYSEKYSIPAKNIGVNVYKKVSNGMLGRSETLKINILNAENIVVMDIDICEFLKINPVLGMLAKSGILSKLTDKAKANKPPLNIDTVNATFYTNDLIFTPSLKLHEQLKFIKELTIEELTQ